MLNCQGFLDLLAHHWPNEEWSLEFRFLVYSGALVPPCRIKCDALRGVSVMFEASDMDAFGQEGRGLEASRLGAQQLLKEFYDGQLS